MRSKYPGINFEPALGTGEDKLNICHHMLTSSTQLQNRSFHVVERTRTSTKCQKKKEEKCTCKACKNTVFIAKYANLWGFCCRRRRGCLSSLIFKVPTTMRSLSSKFFILCLCMKTIRTKLAKVHFTYFVKRDLFRIN